MSGAILSLPLKSARIFFSRSKKFEYIQNLAIQNYYIGMLTIVGHGVNHHIDLYCVFAKKPSFQRVEGEVSNTVNKQ